MKKLRSGGDNGGEYQNGIKKVSNFCILHMPRDVIDHIFSRVRSTVVARCRLVCREWYNHFSSPDFIDYYVNYTPLTTLVLSRCQHPPFTDRYDFSFVEILENGDCTMTNFQPKLPGWPKKHALLSLTGSCNGLLCFLIYDRNFDLVYIYNPISCESIALPERIFETDGGIFCVAYEFGHSPSVNKFKVLRLVGRIDNVRVKKCEIFTIGVDKQWRHLAYPHNTEFPGFTVSLKRAVCWFDRNIDSTKIAVFDYGDETFSHIPHPPSLSINTNTMELVVSDSRFLSLVDYSSESQYTIWTMREYGVVESWTKIVVLKSCFPSDIHVLRRNPFALLRSGNLLFPLKDKGLVYSPKQEECTVVQFLDDERCIVYMNELAPLCSIARKLVTMGVEMIV